MTTTNNYDYLNRLTSIGSANASSVVLDSHAYSYMPVVTTFGVFIDAVVEGIGKNAVDCASAQGISACRFESPGCVGYSSYFCWRVGAGEHQIPALADEIETLRIFGNDIAPLVVHMIQIPRRHWAGKPAHFGLAAKTPFDVTAQIINVFLRHAEFQIHPDGVVLGLAVCLTGSVLEK
jgi:hypothetical protein